jgi:hypothetical protein
MPAAKARKTNFQSSRINLTSLVCLSNPSNQSLSCKSWYRSQCRSSGTTEVSLLYKSELSGELGAARKSALRICRLLLKTIRWYWEVRWLEEEEVRIWQWNGMCMLKYSKIQSTSQQVTYSSTDMDTNMVRDRRKCARDRCSGKDRRRRKQRGLLSCHRLSRWTFSTEKWW